MRSTLLLVALTLSLISCGRHIDLPHEKPAPLQKTSIKWPAWKPEKMTDEVKNKSLVPKEYSAGEGNILTYGSETSGEEQFVVISRRDEVPAHNLLTLFMRFEPTSLLTGENPTGFDFNQLSKPEGEMGYLYGSPKRRSTFFLCRPSLTKESKGLIVYQTSIMFLSKVEEKIVTKFQKRGWNVLVSLPSDSLYQSRLPVDVVTPKAEDATIQFIADEMDRHYSEQAHATKSALEYLRQTRPDWLKKKRILIGTSAGSFSAPAVALKNRGWDSIILISAGTNLLDAYEKGAAGILDNFLKQLSIFKKDHPELQDRIPSDKDYLLFYREASKKTNLKPAILAPHLADQRLLLIYGSLDRIIPKEQLNELHQLTGKPERWTYPLGHQTLALKLIFEVEKIDQWICE